MALSWISLLFIGKKGLRKYGVASLILTFLMQAEFTFASKNRWWWFYKTKLFEGSIPFHWGPFFASCLWMLKLTFGKLKAFLLVITIINFIYAFPGTWLFQKLRIAELGRIKKGHFFSILMVNGLLLYLVQYVLEKIKGSKRLKSIKW